MAQTLVTDERETRAVPLPDHEDCPDLVGGGRCSLEELGERVADSIEGIYRDRGAPDDVSAVVAIGQQAAFGVFFALQEGDIEPFRLREIAAEAREFLDRRMTEEMRAHSRRARASASSDS